MQQGALEENFMRRQVDEEGGSRDRVAVAGDGVRDERFYGSARALVNVGGWH